MKTEPTRPAAIPMPAMFGFSAAIDANRRALLAVADAQVHLLDRMRRSNEEMFRFLDRRLQADRETVRKLAACSSLPEMWTVAMDFFQRGRKDYSEESGVTAAVTVEQAGETFDDLRRESEAATPKAGGPVTV